MLAQTVRVCSPFVSPVFDFGYHHVVAKAMSIDYPVADARFTDNDNLLELLRKRPGGDDVAETVVDPESDVDLTTTDDADEDNDDTVDNIDEQIEMTPFDDHDHRFVR